MNPDPGSKDFSEMVTTNQRTYLVAKLNELSELMAEQDMLSIEQSRLVQSVIPDEVRLRLAEIDEEFMDKRGRVASRITALNAAIEDVAKQLGKSVSGEVLQAVFYQGRVTWDTKKLEGMAALLPQLGQARKVGDPYVTIRPLGRGSK